MENIASSVLRFLVTILSEYRQNVCRDFEGVQSNYLVVRSPSRRLQRAGLERFLSWATT